MSRIQCSPIPVRTDQERAEARKSPHEFLSLADTLSEISGMALGRAIDICYRCGECRLKESSQHYKATGE